MENIEQLNSANDWLQTTKKELDNLVDKLSKEKDQQDETDLTFFEDKLFHYSKGRREEMKNEIERKRQWLPSAKFNLGSGKLNFKEKVKQIILQNPNEENLRTEAEKDLEQEAVLQYEIEELSADLKMHITEEFERYDYFKRIGILPEDVKQFEQNLKIPSLKLLANVFTKNLEESLSEIGGIEKEDIEEEKKNIENSLKYIWTSAEIEKSDCDEDEQTMLKAVYSKKLKIRFSLVAEFDGQIEYLKQSGIPIESLQSIKPKDIAKAEKILDEQEADEEINKKVILKKYAPAVAAAILLISILGAQGMAFAQNAQIDFGVDNNADDDRSLDKEENIENLKDSKLKGEIKDTKQEFQPTDITTETGQQETETDIKEIKTDESGKKGTEVKSDIDEDIGGNEDVEIIDTYEEVGNYIAELNKEYDICEAEKKIEDFNQDEMLKLAIACKVKGDSSQWKEIFNFLEAEFNKTESAESGASYKFALEAEQSLGGFNEDDITKVIGLSRDLGFSDNEIVKLFPQGNQDNARELLNKQEKFTKGATVGRAEQLTKESVATEALKVEKPIGYQGGKHIWGSVEKFLTAKYGDDFAKLGGDNEIQAEALKTYNIDDMKDEIVRVIEKGTDVEKAEFGLDEIKDPDKIIAIKLEKIDYDKIAEKIFPQEKDNTGLTENLSDQDAESIVENNEKLKQFFIDNPNASRSSANYEEILNTTKTAEEIKTGTAGAIEPPVEKSPQDLTMERNRQESINTVLKIFDKKGIKNIDEIYRMAGVNPNDGLQPQEIGRIKILAEHQDLLKELWRISENKREDVFRLILDEKMSKDVLLKIDPRTAELITEIKPNEAIENIPLDETVLKIDAIMNSGKMVEKDILLFGKVLAGDEAIKNMNILLGGAGVKNVEFDAENSRIAAELFNGKNVNIYSDGRENGIEVRTPFLKSKTLFEGIKPFKTNLSKDGLDAVKERIGGKIDDIATEVLEETKIVPNKAVEKLKPEAEVLPKAKSQPKDILKKYGVNLEDVIDMSEEIKKKK